MITGVWKSSDCGVTWTLVLPYTDPRHISIDPTGTRVDVNGLWQADGEWGNGGAQYSLDSGAHWKKNTLFPLLANGRGTVLDPNDPTKLFYTFFRGGLLHGPRPS